ncbi:MAG: PQQ-binding-like beta-propeller repeat protein [Planctomycetales bacterium]|nr:PQQ-binding-like beta-propeller repeat protein [Planctomycetales bacterium]
MFSNLVQRRGQSARRCGLPSWCFVVGSIVFGIHSLSAEEDDWPRFRGTNGGGASRSELPVSWTPSRNVAWRTPLPGPGVSSPIVVRDRLFVTCYSGYGMKKGELGDIELLKRHLLCLDTVTGAMIWERTVAAIQPEDSFSGIGIPAHGYASHTPTSDGKHVYAFFGKSGVVAYDLNGNPLWQTSVGTESDPWKWGSSSSPILYEDLVIVTASAESQAIIGLDKHSGKQVWRQEAVGLDGMWGTPALAKVDDQRTDLVLSVPKEIWGLDPTNGNLRWYCQATKAEQVHSSPLTGGGLVFAFTGRGGGSVAVRAGGIGDVSPSHVIWSGPDSARFGSPVGYRSNLYLVGNGILTTINGRTGKRVSQLRLTGGRASSGGSGTADFASPVIAGGKLYYTLSTGDTYVFELEGDLKQLSVNVLTMDSERFGGSPAISRNRMFVRSDKAIYCITQMESDVPSNASLALFTDTSLKPAGESVDLADNGSSPGNEASASFGAVAFDPVSIFNSRDRNQDGFLDRSELRGDLLDILTTRDKNDDQLLSLQEFRDYSRDVFAANFPESPSSSSNVNSTRTTRADQRPARPQRPMPSDDSH